MPKQLDIRLIAPSGYADNRAACQRAIERLQAAGHRVSGDSVVSRVDLRFAGSDTERAADINRLADVHQPLPDVVMATCGGYGANALLGHLDYEGLARRLAPHPCVFVGHGDFTVIQCALLARSGIGSLHGPMLVQDFGAGYLREHTWRHFWQTLQGPGADASWASAPDAAPLRVEGTLWGGNLSALCSLIGTPYMPDVPDGILFLEESGEQAWRVERMLYELLLGGVLRGQKALVLGSLDGQRVSEYDNGYDIDHALERFGSACGLPMVRGLAIGQGPDRWTLPFGAPAVLQVGAGTVQLSSFGYPHTGVQPMSRGNHRFL